MDTKNPTADQPLLANRHLNEVKDCLASEQQARYQLRGKHGPERERLRLERVRDTRRRLSLVAQQVQEVDQLSQHQLRLATLAQQVAEIQQLRRAG